MEGGSAARLGCWHAIRVTGGRERLIARQLARRGVMLYLPLVDRHILMKTAKGTSARVMQWAMFPGYIFVYSLGLDWGQVFAVPGVHEVLSDRKRREKGDLQSGEPRVLEDRFIHTLWWLELHDSDRDYQLVASKIGAIERQIAELNAPKKTSKKPGRRGRRGWRKRQRK